MYSTADLPRLPQGEADSIARAAGRCQADLTAALSHIAALEAECTRLQAENHATRNEMQVWQLKAHALRTALADLVGAIRRLSATTNVSSAREHVAPQLRAAADVLAACEVKTVEIDKEQ